MLFGEHKCSKAKIAQLKTGLGKISLHQKGNCEQEKLKKHSPTFTKSVPVSKTHSRIVSNHNTLWLLPSPAIKPWKDERMGAWWFFTGAWHLTSLSSFIIKEAVNNHLAVDTITSASIIVWRGEAANFLRCHRGMGFGWGEGQTGPVCPEES